MGSFSLGNTMPEVSESAKAQIDTMTKDELLVEVHKGNSSRFQRENFAYLTSKLAIVQGQEVDQYQQETLNVAKKALATSKKSKNIAWWAIGISLLALIVQIILSK